MDQKGKGALWAAPALPVPGPRPSLKATARPETARGRAQAVASACCWAEGSNERRLGCLCAWVPGSRSQRLTLLHRLPIEPAGPPDARSTRVKFNVVHVGLDGLIMEIGRTDG